MDSKALRVEIKNAAKGEVEAVFSTFNVIDKDGDVTQPGAFTDGAKVAISAYGHSSWGGMLPVGKGTVHTTDTEAILRGRFFLDTDAGRDTFTVLNELGDEQEWSYGFDIIEAEPGEYDGQPVRFLKRLDVHEVSPVLLGAGVDTRTLSMKARKGTGPVDTGSEFKAAIRGHDTPTSSGSWDGPAVVAGIADAASVSDLRSVFAWVDSNGDPEAKGSYKFPHHNGVGGAANMRACVAGIAALNGARGGSSIPGSDRSGVHSHLAGHLRDGDREVPELRSAGGGSAGGSFKLNEEIAAVLAEVDGVLDSATRVVALRAEKGKTLSRVNAEYLDWLDDSLRKLRSLINSPGDELAREFVRFVALNRSGE